MNEYEYKNCQICGERYELMQGHKCNNASTKVRLTIELMKSEAPMWMIEKARQGYYDDYESQLATPITQLVIDATTNGLPLIAKMAKNGEFDGTKEESQAWMNKEGKSLLDPKTLNILFPETP